MSVQSDKAKVRAFQNSFNAVLFDTTKDLHMDKREFYIGDGFQYTLSTYVKFIRNETGDDDGLLRKYDFLKVMKDMKEMMKYPLIPRYVVLVCDNHNMCIYDLNMNGYFDDYMGMQKNTYGVYDYMALADNGFEAVPYRVLPWQEDDLGSFVRRLSHFVSCMNMDSSLAVFCGKTVVEYGKYNSYVLAKYVNWKDGDIVHVNTEKTVKVLHVKHVSAAVSLRQSCAVYQDTVVSRNVDSGSASNGGQVSTKRSAVLKSPLTIYKYLKGKVYKQDDYCKWASSIVYNHVHGIPSVYLVSGPSGCGKTYLWECIREVYDKVTILDASSLSQAGFKGWNLNEIMCAVDHEDGIVVFDEFDKLCRPSYDGHGSNIAFNIQSNFLKMLDEGVPAYTVVDDNIRAPEIRSTKGMTFILCGSFSEKADEIVRKEESCNIGFTQVCSSNRMRAYDQDITMKDVIEYGLIKELASRIIGMTCVKPLSLDDYVAFIGSAACNGAVRQIMDKYGCKIKISKRVRLDIAKSAYDCGLGLRNVTNRLRQKIDTEMFDQWDKLQETKEIILR